MRLSSCRYCGSSRVGTLTSRVGEDVTAWVSVTGCRSCGAETPHVSMACSAIARETETLKINRKRVTRPTRDAIIEINRIQETAHIQSRSDWDNGTAIQKIAEVDADTVWWRKNHKHVVRIIYKLSPEDRLEIINMIIKCS